MKCPRCKQELKRSEPFARNGCEDKVEYHWQPCDNPSCPDQTDLGASDDRPLGPDNSLYRKG